MNTRRKLFILSFLLIYTLFWGACNHNNVQESNNEKKNIAFIVKMKNGDYWKSVKMGVDTAVKEFNVNVDFIAPDDEEDIEGQIKLVNDSIQEKVDAIILAASDYKALANVTEKAYDQNIPVIIVDSQVNTNKTSCCIATDNWEAGNKAGKKLIEISGENCRIAIMGFVKGTRNGDQREAGLLDAISKYPEIKVAAKEYCFSNPELASVLTKKIISKDENIDVIVALNAISSEGAAQAIDEMKLSEKVKVITFDSTPTEIEYLEKGVIDATIIQNPFAMGYLGVKYALYSVEGRKIPKHVDTGSKVIDKDNMYLPENQKLLFPFVK